MRRLFPFLFCLNFVLIIMAGPVRAQASDVRTERLMGVARVWNTVKYFHPYLADRDIAWDKALVDAIPKVNAANTPEEYRDAVNSMLGVLNDKTTYASIPKKGEGAAKPVDLDPVHLSSDVLVVDLIGIARNIESDRSQEFKFVEKIRSLLPKARGVVFDCRSAVDLTADNTQYYLDDFLQYAMPILVMGDVTLGSWHYRVHNGYSPQVGSTSGGYHSGISNDLPSVIAGKAKSKLSLSFIVNDNSPDEAELWGALRSAGVATIVQDGQSSAREFGSVGTKIELPGGVVASIRVLETVNPDGSIGAQADKSVPAGNDDPAMKEAMALLGQPVGAKASAPAPSTLHGGRDEEYAEMTFPATEYRLLASFVFGELLILSTRIKA